MSRRKLHILFVTPGGIASRGGMGRMAWYLTEEIRKHYGDCSIHVLDSYGKVGGIRMVPYFLKCLVKLIWLCFTGRADVVHLNLAAHGSTLRKLLLMRIAQLFRVPTLLHIHASKFIPFCESLGPRARNLLISTLSRASCVVVIGQYWRRYIVDTLAVPAEIVTVIYNAVPLAAPLPPRDPQAVCRIVALGLLGPRKGTPELLSALASPVMQDLEWTALIAGNGAVEESRCRAIELGIAGRVEIPGWVDPAAVPEILSSADVFVLPSHNEGLPVAILEAMAAGLPVITTPVGAIPELVGPETGVLVPAGSDAALAEALAQLIRNPTVRRGLGTRGRERVERDFRIEVTAEKFVSVYRNLASLRLANSKG
jgi:glycosyltransferase involved in cell wall biosynthesis